MSRRYSGRRSSLPICNLLTNRNGPLSRRLISALRLALSWSPTAINPANSARKNAVTRRGALHNPPRCLSSGPGWKVHAIIPVFARFSPHGNVKSSFLSSSCCLLCYAYRWYFWRSPWLGVVTSHRLYDSPSLANTHCTGCCTKISSTLNSMLKSNYVNANCSVLGCFYNVDLFQKRLLQIGENASLHRYHVHGY